MVTLAILIDPNAFSLEFIIWFVSQGYKISSWNCTLLFPFKFKSAKDQTNELPQNLY